MPKKTNRRIMTYIENLDDNTKKPEISFRGPWNPGVLRRISRQLERALIKHKREERRRLKDERSTDEG